MIASDYKKLLSNKWIYKRSKDDEGELINLPHTNQEVPYNYFDEKMYQFISYYEKDIYIEDKARHFLCFEGVMTAFKLFIDGQMVGEYRGGYIPHSIEITAFVKVEGTHKIIVEVDSTERQDIPPFGHVVDYLTFGGIYRDVWYYATDEVVIDKVFFKYEVLEHDGVYGKVKCQPIVKIDSTLKNEVMMKVVIGGHEEESRIEVQKGIENYTTNAFILEHIQLWDIDQPHLYEGKVTLACEGVEDEAHYEVGFRLLEIEPNALRLNGKNITLLGLNRHQSFPYVGYAMPKRVQEQDAYILKHDLGLNAVRTSHYPQSRYFLDACDRLGLLVLEEIPGWQCVSKQEAWREQVLVDVQAMIERDYNHPSIVTWGVRINESQDDVELYTKTNSLARTLDDTRLTSGVRCIERSQFLEDIYTMNDFIHDGSENILRTRERCTGLEEPVPYMVTEFCGHIYPTKKFDNEERLIEHALRHGRIQSLARQKDEVLGAFGWCAFDYYTHYDFGSGDRICYHGVMDMFRLPKFAAATYKSQRQPKDGYVLEPLTYWTRGEKSKGVVFPIHVFTNCNEIEVKLGGVSKGRFRKQFFNTDPKIQYLKHPPFLLNMNNGEWGASWSDAEFIGYDNDQPVISKKFVANPVYTDISVEPDDQQLTHSVLDATRIVVRAVDQIGNTLPYINEVVEIAVEGSIEVIGPKYVHLIGGSSAFWIRTKVDAKEGSATVSIQSTRGQKKKLEISLI